MLKYFLPSLYLLILSTIGSMAFDFVATDLYSVASEEAVESESWIYARSSDVAGTFARDVFLLSELGELTGDFAKDVWAVGMNLRFDGVCAEQLRMVGRTLQVGGKSRGGAALLGETVLVTESAIIGDRLFILGSDVIVEGTCEDDVRIVGNRITIGGRFAGNVEISGGDIVVKNSAVIDGDLIYTSSKELFLPRGVALGGDLVRREQPPAERDPLRSFLSKVVSQSLWLAAALLVGIPFVSLFSPLVGSSMNSLRTSPWRCMLYGTAAVFLTPLFAALMLGIVIGIPLGLMLLSSYGMMLYLAKYPIAMFLGIVVFRLRRPRNALGLILHLASGLAIVYILTALPLVGSTIYFVIAIYGAGALLAALTTRQVRILKMKVPQNEDDPEESAEN